MRPKSLAGRLAEGEFLRSTRAHAREAADVTTSRGHFQVLTKTFMRLARTGDVEKFRAYLRSDGFWEAFKGLEAREFRAPATRCHAERQQRCVTPAGCVRCSPNKCARSCVTLAMVLPNARQLLWEEETKKRA